MSQPSHKSPPRARLITTYEGKFINVDDIRRALLDDQFIHEHCLHQMKIGLDWGDPPEQIMRVAVASIIFTLAGEIPKPPKS